VLFEPRGGPLMLFYKVGPSPEEWWGMVRTSSDGGRTWSEARRLLALGIEQHEMWWQFSSSPAWAAFRADAEGKAMLARYGFA